MYSGKVVAHRVSTIHLPENTIVGLNGLESWVRGVEIDIRMTSDGVPVLMHDTTVDRTTNGTGTVSSKTLAQIKALTVTDKGSNTQVPTLQEMLDAIVSTDMDVVLLDMADTSTSTLNAMISVVSEHQLFDKCIAMVRTGAEMGVLRSLDDGIKIGRFGATNANVSSVLYDMSTYSGTLVMVSPGVYSSNRNVVSVAKVAGFLAGSSTNNAQRSLFEAREDGVDMVLTDISHGMKCYSCGCK